MNFSDALEAMKQGYRVQREGWDDLYLEMDSSANPEIFLKIAHCHPKSWVALQEDLLAEDWIEIPFTRQGKIFNRLVDSLKT